MSELTGRQPQPATGQSVAIGPLLLSERQAAGALNLSIKSLFNLRRAGELSFVRIGSRVMYEPAALDRFIAERRQGRAGG